MLGGHETTANALSWTLFELCKHPEVQTKLRLEIRAQELKIRERGESDFTWKDYESMPYLNAVLKVDLLARKNSDNG
jgi:cytochrome P450